MRLNSRSTHADDLPTKYTKRATKMRVARLKLGLNQEQLAHLAGTTQPTYSRIESGYTRQPDEEILERVAQILEVPKNRLFEEEFVQNTLPGVEQNTSALNPKDIPAAIRDLKELLDDGVITAEEFRDKKKELLARL
jgi:transcriptional regulator with XRE-family HTH domain